MIIEQLMPALSPTMTEGQIIDWKIKKGDQVKSGQVMAEIQTDKAVGEWACLDAGFVAEILVPAGVTTKVNTVAAVFTTKAGEDASAAIAKAKAANQKLAAEGASAAPAKPAAVEANATAKPLPPTATAVAEPPKPAHAGNGRQPRISPVASRMAAASRIDVTQLTGTGPDGRIIKRDIERALAAGAPKLGAGGAAAPAKPKLKPFRADRPDRAVAMSQMRSVIGRRLLQAKTQIPHFYVTERVDAGNLAALREQLAAIDGVKVSVNDLIVRATALALRIHPRLNSTFDGTTIKEQDSADISVAVAIPDGLITPIVFKAHTLSVRQIADVVRDLAKRAVDGKLKPAEFEGGSFTISNLGMYGIEEFNAIINPPQCAILAVGGIKDEPVVRGGAVVAGKTMRLTLSADHRVVDGAVGAEFMKTLRELLEAPAALLL